LFILFSATRGAQVPASIPDGEESAPRFPIPMSLDLDFDPVASRARRPAGEAGNPFLTDIPSRLLK
jgi:hypothetical protein